MFRRALPTPYPYGQIMPSSPFPLCPFRSGIFSEQYRSANPRSFPCKFFFYQNRSKYFLGKMLSPARYTEFAGLNRINPINSKQQKTLFRWHQKQKNSIPKKQTEQPTERTVSVFSAAGNAFPKMRNGFKNKQIYRKNFYHCLTFWFYGVYFPQNKFTIKRVS